MLLVNFSVDIESEQGIQPHRRRNGSSVNGYDVYIDNGVNISGIYYFGNYYLQTLHMLLSK